MAWVGYYELQFSSFEEDSLLATTKNSRPGMPKKHY